MSVCPRTHCIFSQLIARFFLDRNLSGAQICSLQFSNCRGLNQSEFTAAGRFSSARRKPPRSSIVIRSSFWGGCLDSRDPEARARMQRLVARRTARVYSAPCSEMKMNLNEYMVTLEKPLGIRFALSVDGKVFVHALQKGGNAEKSRIIMVGDTLKKASRPSAGKLVEIKNFGDTEPDRPAVAWATWDLIAMVEKGTHDGPPTHAVTFVWNGHEGEEVYLVGDFTGNWKEPIKAVHKGGPRYEIEIRLPQGKYYYKYITNGDWRHSNASPTERDESGNMNNVIVVGDTASVKPTMQPQKKDANIVKVIERTLTENERFMLAKAARCIAFNVCPRRLTPKLFLRPTHSPGSTLKHRFIPRRKKARVVNIFRGKNEKT